MNYREKKELIFNFLNFLTHDHGIICVLWFLVYNFSSLVQKIS